jgi:hypothetical protein
MPLLAAQINFEKSRPFNKTGTVFSRLVIFYEREQMNFA